MARVRSPGKFKQIVEARFLRDLPRDERRERVAQVFFATADSDNLTPTRSSKQALWRLVVRLGERAEIPWRVKPQMRHAFADHVARLSGDVRVAQYLLGHATLGTTEAYLRHPTLDQLAKGRGGRLVRRSNRRRSRGFGFDLQTQ